METEMGRTPLVLAYYVSGHGFGHATRVFEVVFNLILAGQEVYVATGAPAYIFTNEIQSPKLFIRKVSDAVPIACRAAADAGIHAVCVTNFRSQRYQQSQCLRLELCLCLHVVLLSSFLDG